MTSHPPPSGPNPQSLSIVAASIVLATALGFLLNAIHAPESVQGSVLAVAVGLPAAVAYRRQSMHRDRAEDAAQIAQGQLRRPIGLVVTLLVSSLVLAWTLSAQIGLRFFRPAIGSWPAWSLCGFAVAWVLSFLLASYASHYIARHSYRWTAISAGLVSVVLVLAFVGDPFVQRAQGMALALKIVVFCVAVVGFVVACLAGTWHGRSHHDEFLKKKLERIEHNAAPRSAVPSQAQTHEVVAAAPFSEQPAASRHMAQHPSGSDLVGLLSNLAKLRDDGVLTEIEFQVKKEEILARM